MRTIDTVVLKNKVEQAYSYDLVNNKVFGAAYFVYQRNRPVFQQCFGTVGASSNVPVSENTLFRLASMTKPVTAMAVLILVEKGMLSLTDPVMHFIPEFQKLHIILPLANGQPTDMGVSPVEPTIMHLLSHSSGFGTMISGLRPMDQNDKRNTDATIHYWIQNGLRFVPGTQQCYSPVGGFDCLAKIIEIVSGIDLQSFMKQEIFEPCEMTETTFIPRRNQWEHIIAMHSRKDGYSVNCTMPTGCVFEDFPCTHLLGGAGLVSTLHDYGNFVKMLLQKGKNLVSENVFQLLCTPVVSCDIMPGCEQWGLGVRVITNEKYGILPVGSYGWSGAYGSHFWVDPENQIAAVYMKNSYIDGGAANESARMFEKAVFESLI